MLNRLFPFCVVLCIVAGFNTLNAQTFVKPESEWSKTHHLKEGENTFKVLFSRTGWETQQSGTMVRNMTVNNDSLTLFRQTTRGNNLSNDTLIMSYPGLSPKSFSASQADRETRYRVSDKEVDIYIDFAAADVLDYALPKGAGFFDIAALDLVLGGLKRRELNDKHIRLFDHQTSSFIDFSIDEVKRARIEDASGNRHRCFHVKGKLNNAQASFWVQRRSGEMIKSRIEVNNEMAMILLRE